MNDAITIVRARNRRLAKLIHFDGRVDGYDKARAFDLAEHPVADLAALATLLGGLLTSWDTAAVRGAILDPTRTWGVRRLLHRDAETGEPPTLRDVPRRWLALDMEGIARPETMPAADLPACRRLALAALPAAFTGAACIVQASGSHGFKPDLRLRLWFWCDRPLSGAELKRWLRDTPADPVVFGAAQLIYTAAPVMAGGTVDPLPERIVVAPGGGVVKTPPAEALAPPPRPAPDSSPTSPMTVREAGSRPERYARAALIRAAHVIISAGKRHPVIIREAAGLARLVHAGLLSEGELRAVITRAAEQAGKDDADEITSCIAWGLAHASTGKLPEMRDAR